MGSRSYLRFFSLFHYSALLLHFFQISCVYFGSTPFNHGWNLVVDLASKWVRKFINSNLFGNHEAIVLKYVCPIFRRILNRLATYTIWLNAWAIILSLRINGDLVITLLLFRQVCIYAKFWSSTAYTLSAARINLRCNRFMPVFFLHKYSQVSKVLLGQIVFVQIWPLWNLNFHS